MSTSLNRRLVAGLVLLLGLGAVVFCLSKGNKSSEIATNKGRFRRFIVDTEGPVDPWGKAVGDINGDGLPDLIVGGHGSRESNFYSRAIAKLGLGQKKERAGELVWYENPLWKKHVISSGKEFSTDIEVVDIDQDGRNDVVCLTATQILWFRNPDWKPTVIDTEVLHDIEAGDFDRDGLVDIVARNQSAFGGRGDKMFFYRQGPACIWEKYTISCSNGEGLKAADVNGDGWLDIVVNGTWYENSRDPVRKGWTEHPYTRTWTWEHIAISVADINGDGRVDIILAPAEKAGSFYRISWFEAPRSYDSEWQEHIVESGVETVYHFVGAADMDNDGDLDIVTAEMHQGRAPHEIRIYYNSDRGDIWTKKVIGSSGSHNMRLADIDNDCDIDFFGANWSGEYHPVELRENQTCRKTSAGWRRHVIDADKPWRSVFIMAADVNSDGYKDIVTGGWWYRNPGNANGNWRRHLIGEPANNVALIQDFDGDGNQDILASQWKDNAEWGFYERILRRLHVGSHPIPIRGGFVWARNDGKGCFQIMDNIAGGKGDFLQGVASVTARSTKEIALSWHESGQGVQMLRVPAEPAAGRWDCRIISAVSQDEALSADDIDRDGYPDLMLGTRWLRNEGNGKWTSYILHPGDQHPDRNRLVDMNGDGRLDVVVGYEAISALGKVAWYEQGDDPRQPWKEHLIATVVGPMSLDVADIDGDGDIDVVVGEHNLRAPETARLLLFENMDGSGRNWRTHLIYVGDEHHDGVQVVDIDSDGDLDIISIGWSHNRVLLYENKDSRGGRGSKEMFQMIRAMN